ncbi:MAG: dihydroorotate dehydrogenase electron transfer subunit [Clostridiaceae bacterium]|nr:dihydroorotate dehydrogenase electron transfer subunit [Clostridia bacterium]MDY3870992.1 dihydroorotate dehydrogenase electron transfer subunit [Clostridiaceae bacterium]
MKQGLFTVTENTCLAKDIWRMRLRGDTSAVTAPGQFVNLKLEGFFLRRPISVCDVEGNVLTLIYKPLGQGTRLMTSFLPGKELDVLSGLGNGFDPALSGEKPLLVGGGVGIPPLYLLCRRLAQRGVQPAVILGFNTRDEVFLEAEFRALGASVTALTADGSYGKKGLVTDGIRASSGYTYLYTCGPEAMLKAVYQVCDSSGQFSFEERMGCGFGACMGCTCKTKYGNKRICKDGPVLTKEEILW